MNQRVFILAEPRSGSSWLLETLNSHQEMRLLGELFNHKQHREVLEFHEDKSRNLDDCILYLENRLAAISNRYIGCKILLNQLRFVSHQFPRHFIETYREARCIFLIRENIVASQISLDIAHAHNVWHCREGEEITKRTIRVNPKTFLANLERVRERRAAFRELFREFQVKKIDLTYEALFAGTEDALEKIRVFLDLAETGMIVSGEKKGNPFSPQETVENYRELRDYLRAYPAYHRMLQNAKDET